MHIKDKHQETSLQAACIAFSHLSGLTQMSSPWIDPDFLIQKIASQALPSSSQFGHNLFIIALTPTLHLPYSRLKALCLLHVPKPTGDAYQQPADPPETVVPQQILMPSFPPVGSLCPSTYTGNQLQPGCGNPSQGTRCCRGNNPNCSLDQVRAEVLYCYGYRRGQGAAERQPLLMWTIKKREITY